ncbi:MAG: hypothetical protein ACJA0G_001523, partial [Kangiellaceae bacterium]
AQNNEYIHTYLFNTVTSMFIICGRLAILSIA